MALETANFIGQYTVANPTSTDPKSQGDDHLRMIKSASQDSFAGFAGAIIVRGSEAAGATTNDFTVTVTSNTAFSAYSTGMIVVAKATHANTGAATLQVNALGAKTLVGSNGAALGLGDILSGSTIVAYYDGTIFYLLSGNDHVSRRGDNLNGTYTLTGSYDFTAATMSFPSSVSLPGAPTTSTPAAGDNSTKIPTTAFVVGVAVSAQLPGQTGRDGMIITSINGAANWYEGVDQGRLAAGVI